MDKNFLKEVSEDTLESINKGYYIFENKKIELESGESELIENIHIETKIRQFEWFNYKGNIINNGVINALISESFNKNKKFCILYKLK